MDAFCKTTVNLEAISNSIHPKKFRAWYQNTLHWKQVFKKPKEGCNFYVLNYDDRNIDLPNGKCVNSIKMSSVAGAFLIM